MSSRLLIPIERQRARVWQPQLQRIYSRKVISLCGLALTFAMGVMPPQPLAAQQQASPINIAWFEDEPQVLQARREAMQMMWKSNFDALDELLKSQREQEQLWPSGRSKLEQSYLGLRFAMAASERRPDNFYELYRPHLEEWIKRNERSPGAHISYTMLLLENALQAQVGALVLRTDAERKALFNERMREAYAYLLKTREVASVDPHWHALAIDIATGLGEEHKVIDNHFSEGISRFPAYEGLYVAMLRKALPKAGGSLAAMDQVINAANDKAVPLRGKAFLGSIYIALSDEMKHTTFFTFYQWNVVKEALDDLVKRHPRLYYANRAAQLACLSGDHAMSHRMFQPILADVKQPQRGWESREQMSICLAKALVPLLRTASQAN